MINIDNYLRLDLVDVTLVLISTFLMVMLAKKYFWNYAKEYLDKRQNLIQAELDEASERDIKSKQLLDEAKQKIEDVQEQANIVMDKVEAEARKNAEVILKDARNSAERIKLKAQEDIEFEKREALVEMKDEMSNIALLAARKLVEKELDNDTQRKYVKDFIEKAGNDEWQA
ncbi:MAG: F0F1 ATP synthase subunit B [Erysipelotrichaceae bacterium]|nr:F0F1 ATP synthase subunit B [Erysipelotrichaceae bacterium]